MDTAIPAQLAERLRAARRVAVLTGAGVSAESELSTFRGPNGLYAQQDVMRMASLDGFLEDPQKVWQWYDWRRGQALHAQPNPGHAALAAWEARLAARGGRLDLITQNVDGLHQRAGSQNVIELHGSGWVLRCMSCQKEREDRTHPFAELPPRCACGGMLRPGVVWFGEMLPPEAVERAQDAAEGCELFVAAGTSALVYPAAGFVQLAMRSGAPALEVNLEPTPLSKLVTWSLRGKSGEILPALLEKLK